MTGVRVKALAWERDSLGWGWRADSILGTYRVFNGSRWRLCGCGDIQGTDEGSEDAAKSAAQADYETRILAALEPQDTPAVAELVALRAEVAAHKARAEVMHRRAQRAEGALDAAIADGEGWQSLYARKTRDDTGFRMALGGIMRELKNRRAALTHEAKS